MSNQLFSEEEIEIPDTAFVPCPKTGNFSLAKISSNCVGCDYWQGFFRLNAHQQDAPFKKGYSIKCEYPVSREIVEVKY